MAREKQTVTSADVGAVPAAVLAGEPRRVTATGVSVSGRALSGRDQVKIIEAAMSRAVMEAAAAGVTDPDEVRAMMLAARDAAKAALAGSIEATVEV